MSRSLVGLVVLLAACTARIRNTDTPRRPNVVLILADDLGWRDLGCTGSTFYETPAIDHLAAQGMRFTQAYAACSVCSPTRASILTGKYPARLHLTNYLAAYRRGSLLPPPSIQSLPSEEITLAEAFRAAGYRTAIAGKWHLGRKGSLPSDHGFDVTIGADARGTIGPDDDPHFARFLSTKATEFLEESKDRPFFLYLSLYSVHVDLKTLPPLEKKYRDRRAAIDSHETVRDVEAGPGFRARAVQDDPDYAGMVEEMDIAVDHVLREIDRIDRARDTIVLFTSDNGGLSTAEGSPTSNFPLRAGKGWNYEGGLRVPLIVAECRRNPRASALLALPSLQRSRRPSQRSDPSRQCQARRVLRRRARRTLRSRLRPRRTARPLGRRARARGPTAEGSRRLAARGRCANAHAESKAVRSVRPRSRAVAGKDTRPEMSATRAPQCRV
ncbi:MAG: sulfatase-like hydrolase/transferase [Planctomycetes bacterium]|nr:sulfatase-like hydrolase/transferase [Planctomycetota bacterium]